MKLLRMWPVGVIAAFMGAQAFSAPGDKTPSPVSQPQFKKYSESVHRQFSTLFGKPASTGGGVSSWNDLTDKPDLTVYARLYANASFGIVTTTRIYIRSTATNLSGGSLSFPATGTLYANTYAMVKNTAGTESITIDGTAKTISGLPTLAFTDNFYSNLTLKMLGDHRVSAANPHSTTPLQVFGNPTGARYPKFLGNNIWQWERPLEACVNVFDGAPALSCAIDSGSLAFTYGADGLNPVPEMLPYTVKLYEVGLNNNQPVTPDSIKWSVPPSKTLLTMGQHSTLSSFTPTRFGTYSASKSNNWIRVALTRGLKTCIAMVPVSATKIGAAGTAGVQGIQGIQGERGDAGTATITKSTVTDVFTAGTAGGNPLLFFPSISQSDDVTQIGVGDMLTNLRLKILPSGMILIIRPDGKYDFMYDTATRSLRLGNYSTTSSRSNYVIDYLGQVKQYARNGKLIYQTYTSGRVKRFYADSGNLSEHTEPDGKRTLYRRNGTTPRLINYTSGAMVL